MGKKKAKTSLRPGPAAPSPPRWPGGALLFALLPALLAFLLYSDSLRAGFVWDDHNLIESRRDSPAAGELIRLWTSDFWQTDRVMNRSQYYRPLTTTTFFLDRLVFGPGPRGYHFSNLMLYAAACGLAGLVLARFLGQGWTALLLGLAFAAHPAHTENAAWLSGRTDIVCAALMFGALLFYLKADEEGGTGAWIASAVLFVLSLFGKEMSLTLPGVVFLHQLLWHRSLPRALRRAAPFAVLAAVFLFIHHLAATGSAEENVYTTSPAYVANAVRNLGLGVWHSLVPGGFHYLVTATREQAARTYPAPGLTGLALVAAPLLLALAGAAAAAFKQKNVVALGLAAGVLTLLPVSGIIPIGVIFAVRFLLIPSFFFLLAAGALLDLAAGGKERVPGLAIPWPALALAPVIVVYAVMTFLRVPDWRDDVTLMESALKREPDSALAHFLLGNGLAGRGDESGAALHFEEAIRLRPAYPEAEYNLGVIEQRRGRLMEAEARYRRALALRPDYLPARQSLARLLVGAGRVEEARKLLGPER